MQVDAPTEDNDNAEEEPYIVENPTLVRIKIGFQYKNNSIFVNHRNSILFYDCFLTVSSGLGSICQ